MTVSATHIRFCHQIWQLDASVQWIQPCEGGLDIVTDISPFHPVSHIWPDHPADKGVICTEAQSVAVVDCLVGAFEHQSQQLWIGENIPVKRDTPGWEFVVVHRVLDNCIVKFGDIVKLSVDENYQRALSRGHSAGHLAYLALNKVLDIAYWRKDAERKDTLGHRDFNSYAQQTSTVTTDQCVDCYRLGKTLRKRGLNSAEVIEQLSSIENSVNQQLKDWLALDSKVTMRCEGPSLTDSRYWQCDLHEPQLAVIPCGGTHIESLADIAECQVRLVKVDEQNLEMHTHVIAPSQ
ncbi:alanyl-tRNA editing protein [Vibrio olivae]|uniref:Alanyl-tRNA editing protein n=1 Tax=Vibrio olivae TaxID=1243002 RepID=A0ABV5HLH3_9VIBR